jgi:hypothetical protein
MNAVFPVSYREPGRGDHDFGVGVGSKRSSTHAAAARTHTRLGAERDGSLEGWYQNPDGTFSLLVGYFNRNQKETLDIPIGPNNQIEPGGLDQGQPTHFLPLCRGSTSCVHKRTTPVGTVAAVSSAAGPTFM